MKISSLVHPALKFPLAGHGAPGYTSRMTQSLTLTRPDDWHLHLRDGAMLTGIAPETARDFGRAIIMPNLVPPVVTAAQALAYKGRILAALPKNSTFQPLMTLYLTEQTDLEEIRAAKDSGFIHGCKYYPAGATTNSASGVTDLDKNCNPS